MRKRGILVAVAVAATVASVSASASAATSLRGTFTVHFPKGHAATNAPCPEQVFCGVGDLAGYGAATISILEEEFGEVEGSPCLAVARVQQIDLLDGEGSLVIGAMGTFCRPGGSEDSRASPKTYGAPGRWQLTWTVDGSASTGVFAGSSGSGVEVMDTDGGVGVWHLGGTLG